MVSLANDSHSINGSSRGAFFFDDLGVENDEAGGGPSNLRPGHLGSINDSRLEDDEDLLIPDPTVRSPTEDDDDFEAVHTPWVISLEAVAFVALEVAVFLVPYFLGHKRTPNSVLSQASHPLPTSEQGAETNSGDESDCINPYFILLYMHGGFWFITFLFDRVIWWQHKKAQSRGYLEFHRSTRSLRQGPLVFLSFGTAIVLVLSTLLQQFPMHPPKLPVWMSFLSDRLDENNVLQIIVTLEVAPSLLCLFILMARTVHFNGLRHPPDVRQEEAMMRAPAYRGAATRDIGFRDASLLLDGAFHSDLGFGRNTSSVDELLEKQADMIRYLKSHNANLSRKILKLSAELQNRSQS